MRCSRFESIKFYWLYLERLSRTSRLERRLEIPLWSDSGSNGHLFGGRTKYINYYNIFYVPTIPFYAWLLFVFGSTELSSIWINSQDYAAPVSILLVLVRFMRCWTFAPGLIGGLRRSWHLNPELKYKLTHQNNVINLFCSDEAMYVLPWSQRFSFAAKSQETRARKKRREKTSGSESHYHAKIGVKLTSRDRLSSNQ